MLESKSLSLWNVVAGLETDGFRVLTIALLASRISDFGHARLWIRRRLVNAST